MPLFQDHTLIIWRREGDFEPLIRFPVYTLSRRAPSTTRPPLPGMRGTGRMQRSRRGADLVDPAANAKPCGADCSGRNAGRRAGAGAASQRLDFAARRFRLPAMAEGNRMSNAKRRTERDGIARPCGLSAAGLGGDRHAARCPGRDVDLSGCFPTTGFPTASSPSIYASLIASARHRALGPFPAGAGLQPVAALSAPFRGLAGGGHRLAGRGARSTC